ncbi:hypothetical protein [Paraburkholderia sp. GAS334]|uniref:hypothetical protein n=1 Tax=Paraburkholderia sp. GAS334 TaxID=3035131 RepID=UPI003D1FF496
MTMTADEIIIMHGCIESMNLALRAVTKPGDRGRLKIRKFVHVKRSRTVLFEWR